MSHIVAKDELSRHIVGAFIGYLGQEAGRVKILITLSRNTDSLSKT